VLDTGSVRGIHLDLKYLMPNKAYLLDWVRRLPGYGINTLLLEYEDKFPFRKYPFLRDPDAFTDEELSRFLETARQAGLRVIPLVQSLSHLEFALAHEELARLREGPDIPTMCCPLKPDSVVFLEDLYREVLAFHREDECFHLGGDEAWFLGTCDACAAEKETKGTIGMWVEHEKKLLSFLLDQGKRPIVWDDIFWKEPEAVRAAGLPGETILHAWNYNITRLGKNEEQASDAEFGGAGGVLRQVDVYRDAGHDVLGAPCLNYGQLFPRLTPSARNVTVWARKARAAEMLGVINTSWACFHVPLQAQHLLVAATGAVCREPERDIDAAWMQAWLEEEFGAPADGVPEALETLGELWEVPMSSYGRPFTPIIYCYMNMVLHYAGRQDERRKRGAYPLDWDEVDFGEIYRKGVAEVRSRDTGPVLAQLDAFLERYPPACAALRQFAETATRHTGEAEMLAVLADLKLAGARVFRHVLRNGADAAALRTQLEALKPALETVLSRACEPGGAARMLRAWWEPLYRAL
jgi:hypothetical protein